MSPLCVPVCEVTNLTEQQFNVISGSPVVVDIFKKPFLWCCPAETAVKLCPHKFSPCSGKQHLCRDATCPCFQSLYTSLVHLSSGRSLPCQALFCPACLISSILESPAYLPLGSLKIALKNHLTSMDSSSFKSRFPGNLTISWKAPKVHSLQSQDFAGIFFSYLQQFEAQLCGGHDWGNHCSALGPWVPLCLQTIPGITFPSFLTTCTKKLLTQEFPRPLFSLSAVWYSQLNFGKLKLPLRTRAVDTEIFFNTVLTLGLLTAVMRLLWRMEECNYQGKSLQSVTKFFQVDEQMGLD